MRYEINYLIKDTFSHKLVEKTLAIYENRKVLLETIKDMKKEGIKILNVDKVNKNEIYTSIKF